MRMRVKLQLRSVEKPSGPCAASHSLRCEAGSQGSVCSPVPFAPYKGNVLLQSVCVSTIAEQKGENFLRS